VVYLSYVCGGPHEGLNNMRLVTNLPNQFLRYPYDKIFLFVPSYDNFP